MCKKTFCIVVYVDNNRNCLEEFTWLCKSWIYSKLDKDSDIVAVCHPDAIDKIHKIEGVKIISSIPACLKFSQWNNYPYINSVINLCEDVVAFACMEYEFVLKTDCDTFVTNKLSEFKPSGLCFGFGAYAYDAHVRTRLVECFSRWTNGIHLGIHNVGATVMGDSRSVIEYLQCQHEFAERLISEEFKDYIGQWPGWNKGLVSMYAGELALNSIAPQRCSLGLFDHFCNSSRALGSDVLHIHAWHTDGYWSKHKYRDGAYHLIEQQEIDISTIGGYCHWLAQASIEDVYQKLSSI